MEERPGFMNREIKLNEKQLLENIQAVQSVRTYQ